MTNPSIYIVDASVGVKQFIPDLLTSKVNQLFTLLEYPNTEIFVPDLFYIECANVLWKYVRAGLYNVDDFPADLTSLKSFPLRVISTADLMENAVSIAVTHGISAYDASYVALSVQVNATLLTLDQRLVRTLANSSYDVKSFNNFDIPPLP